MPVDSDQNIVQVACRGEYGGQQIVNLFSFAGPDLQAADMLGDFVGNMVDPYVAVYPETYTLHEVAARRIFRHDEPRVVEDVDSDEHLGTRVSLGEELAPFLSVRVTLYSGLAGRSYRGHRSYSGGTESDVDGSALRVDAGSWWRAVQDFETALAARYGDGGTGPFGVRPVVFSQKFWLANAEPYQCAELIIRNRVWTTIRTQNSRKTL